MKLENLSTKGMITIIIIVLMICNLIANYVRIL